MLIFPSASNVALEPYKPLNEVDAETPSGTLSAMKDVLPKARENTFSRSSSSVIDYRYANYDIAKVSADHSAVMEELSREQTALDYINNTVEMEIEL